MFKNLISNVKSYWSFYKQAKTVYDAHSPFLYDFITNVLDTKREYYAYKDIELIRDKLLKINQEVDYKDLGAGSKKMTTSKRKVRDIAKHASTTSRDGRIIHNCVINYHSKLIIELGTSLGIGTSYLALANKNSRVYTLEGDPASAYIANRNFELLGLTNINLIAGKFEDTLPALVLKENPIDLAFIDGHHNGDATLKYFNCLLPHMNSNSVIIFDDIYWSEDMTLAWNRIIDHNSVSSSIDLYTKGFAFINHPNLKEKQHHKLIKTIFKPWRIGIVN